MFVRNSERGGKGGSGSTGKCIVARSCKYYRHTAEGSTGVQQMGARSRLHACKIKNSNVRALSQQGPHPKKKQNSNSWDPENFARVSYRNATRVGVADAAPTNRKKQKKLRAEYRRQEYHTTTWEALLAPGPFCREWLRQAWTRRSVGTCYVALGGKTVLKRC